MNDGKRQEKTREAQKGGENTCVKGVLKGARNLAQQHQDDWNRNKVDFFCLTANFDEGSSNRVRSSI